MMWPCAPAVGAWLGVHAYTAPALWPDAQPLGSWAPDRTCTITKSLPRSRSMLSVRITDPVPSWAKTGPHARPYRPAHAARMPTPSLHSHLPCCLLTLPVPCCHLCFLLASWPLLPHTHRHLCQQHMQLVPFHARADNFCEAFLCHL